MSGEKTAARNIQNAQAIEKDPMWPPDAVPTHITPLQAALSVDKFAALKGPIFKCAKCGLETTVGNRLSEPFEKGGKICRLCASKEKQNTDLAQKVNANWQDVSKECGLEVFERQPEETDTEWRIWEKYRGYYPLKLPTWNELAEATGCAIGTIVKAAQKWSFKVRILEWARYTDADIQEERIEAIRAMNKNQLDLSGKMMKKLLTAVDAMEPSMMKPSEITSMVKVVTDLQRVINTYVEPAVKQASVDTGGKQGMVTKVEDLSEIAEILAKTGALSLGQTVGVEQTTRIIIKGENDGTPL